jgi:HD-like signal output (HDOD) protein
MQSLNDWVRSLSSAKIPVLRSSIEELEKLRPKQDSLAPREVSQAVLRDPLLTLTVLRFSQSRLTRRQPTEVTTVQNALMMHGLTSFFRETRDLVPLQQQLASNPRALEGAMAVISRAIHAASYARNFAALRHDVDSDEVVTSALLHDLAELLLWCVVPNAAMQIEHMIHHQRGLRSASAQRVCLGFTVVDLQLALSREWRLPAHLTSLMDDQHTDHPRTRTVARSVAIARHSANGWYDPALPDDHNELQKLVNLPPDQIQRWVRQSAMQAARLWRYTGVRPSAAWIPMLAGEWPEEPLAAPATEADGLVTRVLDQLAGASKATELQALVALAFYALQVGLGLRRLWFGLVNESSQKVEARLTLLLDPGLLPAELTCELGTPHLFARLLTKVQGVWFGDALRDKLTPLLPQKLRQKLGARDFYAFALHRNGQPFGLAYADGGAIRPQLDERGYDAFKKVWLAMAAALDRSSATPAAPERRPA